MDDGREDDDVEELEKVRGGRDVQLEPGPEKWGWQVVGSHQAGRVSHCRRGEVRHCCGCL